MKIFCDANVYYAAAKSDKGASHIVLNLAKFGLLELWSCGEVLTEAERNVKLKENEETYLGYLEQLESLQLNEVKVKENRVEYFSKVINELDAVVLAGAEEAKAEFLVTLDRKHFLVREVREAVKFEIVTPGELIEKVRGKLKNNGVRN